MNIQLFMLISIFVCYFCLCTVQYDLLFSYLSLVRFLFYFILFLFFISSGEAAKLERRLNWRTLFLRK